jgi:hypothetical protein
MSVILSCCFGGEEERKGGLFGLTGESSWEEVDEAELSARKRSLLREKQIVAHQKARR